MKKAEDMNVKLTIRSIILFEELSGKSFGSLEPDDFILLLYSIMAVQHPELRLTFEAFKNILGNKNIAQELLKELEEELQFIEATTAGNIGQDQKEGEGQPGEPQKIGDVALSLALNYGIDIKYIMDEMRMWELVPLARAAGEKTKGDMADKRFWTYLTIMPHIDAKKAGGPEKLLPFPWEQEDKKNNAEKFMNDNTGKIMDFFKKQNEDKNAEWVEDKHEPAGLHEDNEQSGQA